MNPDTRDVEAVVVYRDRLEYQILDDAVRGDIEALQRLHAGELLISDRNDNDTTWLVAFDDDCGPLKFYTWDRAAGATFLFDHRPQLNDYPLVPMEPFTFTARDGLTIHGYLSFPAGVERVICQPFLSCMAARGPAKGGDWIPRRSGSRTVGMRACK